VTDGESGWLSPVRWFLLLLTGHRDHGGGEGGCYEGESLAANRDAEPICLCTYGDTMKAAILPSLGCGVEGGGKGSGRSGKWAGQVASRD